MGDPLLLPAIAILAGIVLGRALEFRVLEAAWPIAAFALLALLSRRSCPLTWTCALLACLFAGVTSEAWHRPGPRPTIDAGPRETMILEGCVVEPTVLSPGRERFTLELAPHARARVSLT